MVEPIDVLIVGGGISGLTLANLLIHRNKKQNFRIKIFESRMLEESQTAGIGGGIGLWPPSQEVLRYIPNYQQFINNTAFPMPSPSYRDSNGQALAKANKDFCNKFPVLSLNRDDLINWLLENLKERDDVEFIYSQKISDYERGKDKVIVKTEDGIEHQGDLLVACDGIHSKIRNCLMTELDKPQIKEKDLGYTYFRANTNIPAESDQKWWSAAVETWGSHQSAEHGNHEIRFGYVPLKPPTVFWFIAVKTKPAHQHLAPIKGVKVVGEETKQFLTQLVKSWAPITNDNGEKVFDYAELINLTPEILRTDIAKIENVEKFPWTSDDKRIVLLGDSAHATAPNIAQGAGLCIEDAACLASKLERVDFLSGLSEYEQERKQRAKTVQTMADLIATVGQTENSFTKRLRNGFMRTATQYLPSLQQTLFNYAVSHSLGGSNESAYWSQAPLFNKVFPDNESLDNKVRDFKTSPTGGSGTGVISVENPSFIAKFINPILGLPKAMTLQPFAAEVTNLTPNRQFWKRVFAYKTPTQKTYSTTHSSYCDSNRQTYLSEGIGGYFDRAFRFIYTVNQQQDNSLKYESQGLTFFDLFKIPLPSFLLPKSEWVEKPTDTGWDFDGTISLPLIGDVMHYHGHFAIDKKNQETNRRVIIAGGSGMIGKEVCLEFMRKGYDVYCLSRSTKTQVDIEGVKVRDLHGDWSDLIGNNTIIINLSGSNPGSSRWSAKVKKEIAESRYQTIGTIIKNIAKSPKKPLKFLQASAAGYYGNAGDLKLTEASKPIVGNEPGTEFRIEVCQEIEKRAAQANCDVVNLRIGHVLSNNGGLLPYYRLSGFFNASRFGSGNQYVPFIHIKDVAKSIEFIANNDGITQGGINLTAPTPCSNSKMLKELRLANWIPGIPLPESALKLLIGESAVILTDSERVLPEKLLANGYEFEYPTIQDSLKGLK